MTALFWLENPKILLNKNNIYNIWPFIDNDITLESKLNSFTRTIILLSLVFYIYNKKFIVLLTGFITIILLIIIYYLKKKQIENFETIDAKNLINCVKEKTRYKNSTIKNPLANTLLTDLPNIPNPLYEPNKYINYIPKKSAPAFNNDIKNNINKKSRNIKNKLYRDLGDNNAFNNIENKSNFDILMRQFYTMPNTENPSNQKKFAEFCYGNMNSRKTLKEY